MLDMTKPQYKIIKLIALFIVGALVPIYCFGTEEKFPLSFCPSKISKEEKKSLIYEMVINTYHRVAKDSSNPEGVWDMEVIRSDPALAQALEEYRYNKRGHMVKKIKLSGLTAQGIHDLLLQQGFKHRRQALRVALKQKTFWLKDGSTTQDDRHPDIVPHDIYTHIDGSMVRVKPFGIPDLTAKTSCRSAHVSKSVLKCIPSSCTQKECNFDTQYSNEAFKVTDLGYPVPKAPFPQAGLKLPYDNNTFIGYILNDTIKTTVATLSHIKLTTDCSPPQNHPPKKQIKK